MNFVINIITERSDSDDIIASIYSNSLNYQGGGMRMRKLKREVVIRGRS